MRNVKVNDDSNMLYKHTATIHIVNRLSLVERKIYNILMENAYKTLLTNNIHHIAINELKERLGYAEDTHRNHDFIKTCLFNLVNNTMTFNLLGKDNKSKSAWRTIASLLAHAELDNGMISYSFPQPLSMLLAKPSIYSPLNLSYQTKFSSKYSLAFWEFCSEQLSRKGLEAVTTEMIPIEILSELLGGKQQIYDEFKDFKRYVLNVCIVEVNGGTDLIVDYKLIRKNRKVIGIELYIQRKIVVNTEQIPLFKNESNFNDIDIIKYIDDTLESQDVEFKANNLGIGESQLLAMSKKFDYKTLNKAMDYISVKIKNGQKIDNIGGYLWSILENGLYEVIDSGSISEDLMQKNLLLKLSNQSQNKDYELFIKRCAEIWDVHTMSNWISHLQYVGYEDEVASFSVPSNFIKEWMTNNYLETLLQIWQEQFPDAKAINLIVNTTH